MSDWRYIASRLNGDGTEEFLDFDLPLTGLSYTTRVTGADEIQATVAPEYARLKGDDGRPIFEPWSTAVYVEASGVIRCGGIVTPESSMEGATLNLDCIGFTGYATGMAFDGDEKYIQADPLDITRDIWAHLQGEPGGNLGLVLDGATSPVKVGTESEDVEFQTGSGEDVGFEAGPYKLDWWSTDDLGAKLSDLASNTPFDWREIHAWDGEVIRHRLEFGYPTLGKRRQNLRFALGENIATIPTIEFGDEYASDVLVLGSGEGRKMVRASANRKTRRLRRTAVVTDKGIDTKSKAQKRADREVKWRLGEDDISQIQVRDHGNAPLGTFHPGDEIYVQGEDFGWADEFGLWVRILSVQVQPDDGDVATLEIARAERVGA